MSTVHPDSERAAGGLHVGIIMDGNGRWATTRGRSRYYGYPAGAKAVRRVVRAAPDLGIRTLTLYAFSADNWRRPEREVQLMFRLFERYLRREKTECIDNGVRLEVIGRRDRLSTPLLQAIDDTETATRAGAKLLLRLAVDYSARQAILDAARRYVAATTLGNSVPNASTIESLWLSDERIEEFGRVVGDQRARAAGVGEVDLVIRTGGEQRLSDFLLWEAAYAELYFTEVMWPDFDRAVLAEALAAFAARDRRFGRVTAPADVAGAEILTAATTRQ